METPQSHCGVEGALSVVWGEGWLRFLYASETIWLMEAVCISSSGRHISSWMRRMMVPAWILRLYDRLLCYSVVILSRRIGKIRLHLIFAQNVLKVGQKLIQEDGLEFSGGHYLGIYVREFDLGQAYEDVDDRDSGVYMMRSPQVTQTVIEMLYLPDAHAAMQQFEHRKRDRAGQGVDDVVVHDDSPL